MYIGNFVHSVYFCHVYTPWPRRSSGRKWMHLCEISGFCDGGVEVFAFLDVTQRWLAVSHQHFGTAYHSLFTGPKQSKRNFIFLFLFCISSPYLNLQEKLLKIFIFIYEYLCERVEDCQPWKCLVMPCHTIDMIWYCLAELLQTWTCRSPWRWKKNCSLSIWNKVLTLSMRLKLNCTSDFRGMFCS